MSILTQQPTQITNDQKLAMITNRIKSISARTYSDLVKVQKDGIESVWHNPQFTPQQIIDSLGDDAIKIFNFHGRLTDYLVDVSAVDNVSYTPALPTNSFVFNEDGSITVTDQPYVKP